MSKKVKKKKSSKPTADSRKRIETTSAGISSKYRYLLFLAAFLLYANTLSHDYTQDDAIVIYDNMYTKQGFSGIPGLWTKDTFFGFFKKEGKDNLVSGGRYRPLTPTLFALEWQLFGRNPFVGHLINVLLYGLLGLVMYKVLTMMFNQRKDLKIYPLLPLIITALYLFHPIHTEVVANIKGRDEIVSMLGALYALYLTIKGFITQKRKYLIWSGLVFLLALFSKENAITFLAIIPLSLYFFYNTTLLNGVKQTAALWLASILFITQRTAVLGFDFGGTPMELMNNPYIKIVGNQYMPFDFGEKFATIIYTLGKYISLLIYPHPLTHDYYPRHIAIMSFTDWQVLLSLLSYIALVVWSLIHFKRKKLYSFGILFFIITLSIVSNIVFPIGTNMSERFMFMPSLGFSIILGYLLVSQIKNRFGPRAFYGVLALILGLYAFKTVTRNTVWKNDYTLFTTDVKTSVNSAKVLNAAGGALTTASVNEKNPEVKNQMLNDAIQYLNRAKEIHPNYKNATLLLGNAYYYLGQYEQAIANYEQALRIDPNYSDAIRNLGVSLRDGGRKAGQEDQNLPKAIQYLERACTLIPTDYESFRLLGISYGFSGNHQKAIENFAKAIKLDPDNAQAYVNLGNAYMQSGNENQAQRQFQLALSIDPNAMKR